MSVFDHIRAVAELLQQQNGNTLVHEVVFDQEDAQISLLISGGGDGTFHFAATLGRRQQAMHCFANSRVDQFPTGRLGQAVGEPQFEAVPAAPIIRV